MKRLWVPIVDTATATEGFEKAWPEPLKFLRECMDQGGVALVHCRAGLYSWSFHYPFLIIHFRNV